MATSLNTILSEMKTVALSSGFTSAEEIKFNLQSIPDTELSKLFIKLIDIDYDNFLVDSAEEIYKLELIMVMSETDNPISDLKSLCDTFLKNLTTTNVIFGLLAKGNKITIRSSRLSNDRDVYSKLGGQSLVLRMDINNINSFGNTPCQ